MTEFQNKFFSRVHCLREKSELTSMELAERSGVSLGMLEQLERNILPEDMTIDDAFALADAFHCKAYELFE